MAEIVNWDLELRRENNSISGEGGASCQLWSQPGSLSGRALHLWGTVLKVTAVTASVFISKKGDYILTH